MGTHMKTTIDISDALLIEARKVATRDDTTVRALVEQGLREVLSARRGRQRFKLKLVTATGSGLQPGVPDSLPRELAYEFS